MRDEFDILACLGNISSEEVFTPTPLAKAMLDILPKDIWTNPNVRILDPVCKSGVFLLEAAKRLDKGLKTVIPDMQERINHILEKQIFGIPVTKLTSSISRRTLYGSKTANDKYSIAKCFSNGIGNVPDACSKHEWVGGRCTKCGAQQKLYSRQGMESYAYPLLHDGIEEIFGMPLNFDVIIGNPPYQQSDGGAYASAKPIYNLFVERAKELNPQHRVMIFPARWYTGGKGLDDFRSAMLADEHIKEMHDFPCASDCFPGLEIKGGVCIVHWDSSYNNAQKMVKIVMHPIGGKEPVISIRPLKHKDMDIFVRHEQALNILEKIEALAEDPVSMHVSSSRPFGLRTFFASSDKFKASPKGMKRPVRCWGKGMQLGFVEEEDIPVRREWIGRWKVFAPRANNIGTDANDDNLNSFYGIDEICTESYIVIGAELGLTEETVKNFAAYLRTKFARFCHSLAKVSQDATARTYRFVPMQDFSRPWTDEELYKKYNLTDEEIAFIEKMIQPM